VTVGSNYLAQIAKSHISSKKIELHPLGVDTCLYRPASTSDDRSPLSNSPDAMNVLNVASLVAIKDQMTLFRAASRLIEAVPNVHLHFVGEGPLLATLQSEAKQLEIDNHVHFLGPVAHEELPAFYRAADFCVLTSRHEAQAMVVLEAAAVGRATIGTSVGLLAEFLPEDVVPVGDVTNLARRMIEYAQSPTLRRQRGEEALIRTQREYSLDLIVPRWLKLYDSIATRDGSTSPDARK
jgi:glycosyltransferase involved in cell wall biosynthesis